MWTQLALAATIPENRPGVGRKIAIGDWADSREDWVVREFASGIGLGIGSSSWKIGPSIDLRSFREFS